MPTKVVYGVGAEAWADYRTLVESACSGADVRRVCDLGGGANPYLRCDEAERLNIEYSVLDISADELAKAPDEYEVIIGDVLSKELAERYSGSFDLIFSKFLAEHVSDAQLFHANILKMLRPGGTAIHLIPTLYAIPFVVNRFTPTKVSSLLLNMLKSRYNSSDPRGKFPAYYKLCRGPNVRQLSALQSIGYEVDEARGYFGHEYFRRLKTAQAIEDHLARLLVSRRTPLLTSYSIYVLRRPLTPASA